jgi:hypothetical protein
MTITKGSNGEVGNRRFVADIVTLEGDYKEYIYRSIYSL